ncbi:MAG TPA: PQQ-binding-like beta-propeller repeat protein [Blastocatellia bacterium]|nr:PQQ-binding-like beta-propeller repeat protein [Blastocatellia bacterium]
MKRTKRMIGCLLVATCILNAALAPAFAEDWPEWRGKGRTGIWTESGILDKFPEKGLTVAWRAPLHGGFAGPAVAAGRVFVTDFKRSAGKKGTERALCLDEKTGKIIWTREWDADYRGVSYDTGPRATPTVDGERVYILGASGTLLCLNARTGNVIWQKDYVKDYGMQMPAWGISSAPLVDGDRLIAIVGGQPDAKVMAFDKMTGKEIWRALASDSEQGYSQPIIYDAGGIRRLIIWHPTAVVALDPATGKVYWEQPSRINMGVTLSTPVLSGSRLLVSSFYNGSMLLDLAGEKGDVIWKGKSSSEINTDGLHTVVNTPVIDGDYIYGICSYGQFRCLNLKTGERVWETMEVTKEKARWASGFIVRNGDRYFINNDRGELIIAKLSAKGYQEISRTQLIKPTTNPGNRRELGVVNWTHPAYANRHVVTRNDEEIISVSLER